MPNQGGSNGVSGSGNQASNSSTFCPYCGGQRTDVTSHLYPCSHCRVNHIAKYYAAIQQQLQNGLGQQAINAYPGQLAHVNSLQYTTTANWWALYSASPIYSNSAPPKPLASEIVVGELVGWRGWKVCPQSEMLRSYTAEYVWPPGEKATGKPTDYGHEGIYAFKTLADFLKDFSGEKMVYGRVHLWGEVIEHEKGWRAEFAKIVSLDGKTGVFGFAAKRQLARLRDRYGVKNAA